MNDVEISNCMHFLVDIEGTQPGEKIFRPGIRLGEDEIRWNTLLISMSKRFE
jgi:hypothetical protein